MACDLLLVTVGVIRLYVEFLGVHGLMTNWCQWPWSHATEYLEPVLVGILSADQLFLLLLSLDQVHSLLLSFHFPSVSYPPHPQLALLAGWERYAEWGLRGRPYLVCLLCFLLSTAVAVATTTRPLIEYPDGRLLLPSLLGESVPVLTCSLSHDWTGADSGFPVEVLERSFVRRYSADFQNWFGWWGGRASDPTTWTDRFACFPSVGQL